MPTQGQLRRQARLLARVKFGGEFGALAQMLGDAKAQRKLAIHNAGAGAGALVNTLEGLRPKVASAYDAADAQRAQGGAEAQTGLAGLSGPVVDAIRASLARESAGATAASSGDRAAALTDIGERQAGARSGAIGETRAAQAAYRQDAEKIFTSLTGLQSRAGDYIASTTMDLSEKQRDRAIREGNLDVSRQSLEERVRNDRANRRAAGRTAAETERHHRADEAAARARERRQAAKDKAGGGAGRKPLTRVQQNDFIDKVDTAANWARQLKRSGKNGHQVRQALINGVNQKITKPDGTTVTVKIPAYPVAAVNAAMDLAYRKEGNLGPENKRRIKKRGVQIPAHWRTIPAG